MDYHTMIVKRIGPANIRALRSLDASAPARAVWLQLQEDTLPAAPAAAMRYARAHDGYVTSEDLLTISRFDNRSPATRSNILRRLEKDGLLVIVAQLPLDNNAGGRKYLYRVWDQAAHV